MEQRTFLIMAAFYSIAGIATPDTGHCESASNYGGTPRGQPNAEPQNDSQNKIGRTAETGSGEVGQREEAISRQSIVQTLGRINSRINARIDNRLDMRIDRNYDPSLDVTSSTDTAESEIRNPNPHF